MDYEKTVEFLYGCLPQFQRDGASAYKSGLDTSLELDSAMGSPSRSFRSVHVAGTNGKGSTSQMIYEGLRAEGHRVGLYTSPHLVDFRERIVVDDQMIPRSAVVEFVEQSSGLIERLHPSFFELTVAMSFWWFARCGVDWAVVEVGMGGRLDSTNILGPQLCVVTNISLDHTQFLGATVADIAAEKAGIIKAGVPVVLGERSAAYDSVFEGRAAELAAPLVYAQQLEPQPYTPAMSGSYQRHNAQTAYAAMQQLGLADSSIQTAIETAVVRGRWQVLGTSPRILCDTAHNEAGLRGVCSQLVELSCGGRLIFIIGVVSDKDLAQIIPLLPTCAHYIVTEPSVPRALPHLQLLDALHQHNLCAQPAADVRTAVELARSMATESDTIFIGGSTFTVADALPLFD